MIAVEDTVLSATTSPDVQAPHLALWNSAAFYELRPDLAATRVVIEHHHADGRLIGSLVGSYVDGTFTSGASAPIGGPDFARSYETVDGVAALLDAAGKDLIGRDVSRMEFRLKPPHSSPTEPAIGFLLLARGFRIVEANLNFFIELGPLGSIDDYMSRLKKPARRAISKGEALGIEVAQLEIDDEPMWAEAFDVLRENRESKGRPMRLSLNYIRAIRDAFPGLIRMLVATHETKVIGSALIYRTGPGEDVVQYWGDAYHDLPQSPMNLLVREVVRHSLGGGASFLDIGISTDHGEPNLGLIQFKRTVGCQSEIRLELAHDDIRTAFGDR